MSVLKAPTSVTRAATTMSAPTPAVVTLDTPSPPMEGHAMVSLSMLLHNCEGCMPMEYQLLVYLHACYKPCACFQKYMMCTSLALQTSMNVRWELTIVNKFVRILLVLSHVLVMPVTY